MLASAVKPRVCQCRTPAFEAGDEQAERPAPHSQQQGLGEQLAHEPRARGAEREADRDLPVPQDRARQHQVGDIRADDEQDDRDDRREDPRCRDRGVIDVIHAAGAGLEHEPRHLAVALMLGALLLAQRPQVAVIARARGLLERRGEHRL